MSCDVSLVRCTTYDLQEGKSALTRLLEPLGGQLDNLVHNTGFAFVLGLLSLQFCLNDHVISPIFMWLLWSPFMISLKLE